MRLRETVTGAVRDLSEAGAHRSSPPAGALRAVRDGAVVWVFAGGETYRLERVAARGAAEPADLSHDLVSPMPGRVRAVLVVEGETVAKGATLFLLEAMKMEHPVRAPREGVVRSLRVAEGAMVSAGERLGEME
ncbi:MAG TPA: biotin/lipoyl-containing protein [Thermoanaerobaculia bacterium]|nr:biotin/lipoyl-containing protein [Thermoanaerobaculia bacterium]